MNATINRLWTGLVLSAGIAAMPVQAQQPPTTGARLDQVVEEDIRVVAHPCAIPGIAAQIAKAVQMPGGFEFMPNICAEPPVPANAPRINLRGMSARQALDKLVEVEPRYRWIETAGVVVMRPAAAWDDPSHFLHKTISSYDLEAPNYAIALQAVSSLLYSGPVGEPTQLGIHSPQAERPISVRLTASPYEALNTIVRAHGALRWTITYCAPEARHQFSTLRLETYDGSGLGISAVYPPDANAVQLINCRPYRRGAGYLDAPKNPGPQ